MLPFKALWNQVPFISLAEGGGYSLFLEGIEKRIKSGQKKNLEVSFRTNLCGKKGWFFLIA